MKNYNAPEMKIIAFVAEETIAANAAKNSEGYTGSNIYNDAEFDW